MNKNYLISWCDDNHFPCYWFNTTFLGCEIQQVIKSALQLKTDSAKIIEKEFYPWDFPEELEEQLFDYFQTMPQLDEVDIKLMVKEDWYNFYEKNIKKIRRKVLTK